MGAFTAALLAFVVYQIPPVHGRLAWRVDLVRAYIGGMIYPADRAPTPIARASMDPRALTLYTPPAPATRPTPAADSPSDPSTAAPQPALPLTEAPALTPTPLPDQVRLEPPAYEKQTINNCGPATLALYLRMYGWEGSQKDIADMVKPFPEDRNVNVDELEYFVRTRVGWLTYQYRVGEKVETIKRFLAAGMPVMIEETFKMDQPGWPRDDLWAGHYLLITGYNDAQKAFTTQDTYYGPNRPVDYGELDRNWESFNRVLILIYRPEDEPAVQSILGADWDRDANREHALAQAQAEAEADPKDAFAWFNAGTNLVYFERYAEAVQAYDTARQIGLPQRMFRYQFGPFLAYFNASRDDDLLALTQYALERTPNSEEARLWHGWALYRKGDKSGAAGEFHKALELRPGYGDAEYAVNFVGQ
ncbi:MAG TPA: C39 family peptidase [Anaerolineaceae bacterium]|nr:C39 family peptidase [Anaerolineaceae bacterium]